jgi:hypothetical protein
MIDWKKYKKQQIRHPNQKPLSRHNRPRQIQRLVTPPRPAPTSHHPSQRCPSFFFSALFDFLALSPSLSAAAAATTPPSPCAPPRRSRSRPPTAQEAEACRPGPPVQRGALRAFDDVSVPGPNPSRISVAGSARRFRSAPDLRPDLSSRFARVFILSRSAGSLRGPLLACICAARAQSVCAHVARSVLVCGF